MNGELLLNAEEFKFFDKQWSRKQFYNEHRRLLKNEPIEDVFLKFFRTSSSETMHQLLHEISENITQEQGLKRFKMEGCWDNN